MAAITWSAVVAFAPQLAALPLSFQTDVLGYVNETLEAGKYGGEDSFRLREARIYLACHMGEIWLRKGQGGAVTGETISSTSASMTYAAPFHGYIQSIETTGYGLEFVRITNSLASVAMPVVW